MKKWKRWAAVCLTAVCLLLPATGCTGEDRLVAGIDVSHKPLSYRDSDGTLTGYEVDLAAEVAKRAGMTVRFVPVDWSKAQSAMADGKVNSLWGNVVPGNIDKTGMLYVQPVLYDSEVILTPKDTDITGFGSLPGKAVGAMQNSRAAAALTANPVSAQLDGGAPQLFDSRDILFQALDSMQLDAVCLDDSEAEYTLMQDLNDYTVQPGNFGTSVYAVGVRRNDSRLRNRLQTALTSLRKDGTVAKLSQKWFGKNLTVPAGQ